MCEEVIVNRRGVTILESFFFLRKPHFGSFHFKNLFFSLPLSPHHYSSRLSLQFLPRTTTKSFETSPNLFVTSSSSKPHRFHINAPHVAVEKRKQRLDCSEIFLVVNLSFFSQVDQSHPLGFEALLSVSSMLIS